jgi:menaquinone-dependent protoporphyrinogen oxidase
MRVLITAATKHGATGEIAQVIGEALRERGLDPTVLEPERVDTVDGYDAVVLGSAVYAGHWLKPARELVARCGDALAARPVWLFSSGPVGDPPKPEEDPVDVAEVVAATGAREHRVFAGKLVRKQLTFPERAIVSALRVPEGDFRDWAAISGWAASIATALGSRSPAAPGRDGHARQ